MDEEVGEGLSASGGGGDGGGAGSGWFKEQSKPVSYTKIEGQGPWARIRRERRMSRTCLDLSG